ncbi:protein of unknown function [Shewanella benthica]|uniref:Uncharacterized protein n=1 Tax=Shewanella benthica TaxID=43661 RepID=A0A330M8G2_9GAMM|nr:protein of unknown function [Shewanella benthica]
MQIDFHRYRRLNVYIWLTLGFPLGTFRRPDISCLIFVENKVLSK